MATIDFSKGVDFSPLEQLGLTKADGINFLTALATVIDAEFQVRVRSAFTEEEFRQIGIEAEKKGIKPEDGIYFLEKKYFEKTGRYFLEETRQLLNEYIRHAANIISQARSDAQEFSKLPEAKEFERLMNEAKFEEAAKLFDQSLSAETSTPRQLPVKS